MPTEEVPPLVAQVIDGLDYKTTRGALREVAERMVIQRIDVDNDGYSQHAHAVTLELHAINGTLPDVLVTLTPKGGGEMGDLRIELKIEPLNDASEPVEPDESLIPRMESSEPA